MHLHFEFSITIAITDPFIIFQPRIITSCSAFVGIKTENYDTGISSISYTHKVGRLPYNYDGSYIKLAPNTAWCLVGAPLTILYFAIVSDYTLQQ